MRNRYHPVVRPLNLRRLPDGSILATSESGDHAFLTEGEARDLIEAPHTIPLGRQAELRARFSDAGAAMSPEKIDLASESVFESEAQALTVEYQGGNPLLRFDLVQSLANSISATVFSYARPPAFQRPLKKLDGRLVGFVALRPCISSTKRSCWTRESVAAFC